jgi:hypothetical protein
VTVTEKIQAGVQKVPTPYQAEVLDFVEYHLTKATRSARDQEDSLWSDLALTSSMRGMEAEECPQCTKSVFDRYRIVSPADLQEAAGRLAGTISGSIGQTVLDVKGVTL